MRLTEYIYSFFYTACFCYAIYMGVTTGFRGYHIPALPLVIEVLTLPVGFILFLIDSIRLRPLSLKKLRVHLIGLSANVAIVVFVLLLAFH